MYYNPSDAPRTTQYVNQTIPPCDQNSGIAVQYRNSWNLSNTQFGGSIGNTRVVLSGDFDAAQVYVCGLRSADGRREVRSTAAMPVNSTTFRCNTPRWAVAGGSRQETVQLVLWQSYERNTMLELPYTGTQGDGFVSFVVYAESIHTSSLASSSKTGGMTISISGTGFDQNSQYIADFIQRSCVCTQARTHARSHARKHTHAASMHACAHVHTCTQARSCSWLPNTHTPTRFVLLRCRCTARGVIRNTATYRIVRPQGALPILGKCQVKASQQQTSLRSS